jgi:hypothetical protein
VAIVFKKSLNLQHEIPKFANWLFFRVSDGMYSKSVAQFMIYVKMHYVCWNFNSLQYTRI